MLELPVDELSEEMSIAFTTKSMRTEEILKEKSGEFTVPIDWDEVYGQP